MSETKSLPNGPTGEATIISELVMLCVVFGLILTRIYVRLKLLQNKLILSDYFLFAAYFFAIAHFVCDILMFKYGVLNNKYPHSKPKLPVDPARIIHVFKVFYAASFPFYSALFFNKFSILAFIYTIFPPHERFPRVLLYFVSVTTVVFWIINMFLCVFYCEPVSDNWSFSLQACTTFGNTELFNINWAFNISSDIAVFLLPFSIFPRLLKLPNSEKLGLAGIFSLGIITIAITLARFISVHEADSSIPQVVMWSSMDISVGLIVACLPSIRPLFRKTTGNSLERVLVEAPFSNKGSLTFSTSST